MHLDKIRIKNTRRFADEVDVDFGEGATIILAPNGTGKTTIFEAIELALTGEVSRLNDAQEAIIRDKVDQAYVRLDFSCGKYCQAIYERGSSCSLSGDHENIFDLDKKESLPYLFRLTHYLEQRGKQWIVGQEGREAGEALHHLAVDNNLQKILTKKVKILREAGARENELTDKLEEVTAKRTVFESFLEKRNNLTISEKLAPLEEISEKIEIVGKLVDADEFGADINVDTLSSYCQTVKSLLKDGKNSGRELQVELKKLVSETEFYVINMARLRESESEVSQFFKKRTEINGELESAEISRDGATEDLDKSEAELAALKNTFLVFESKTSLNKDINSANVEREELSRSLESSVVRLNSLNEFISKGLALENQYQVANEIILVCKKRLAKIDTDKECQVRWRDIEIFNKNITVNDLPVAERAERECLISISTINEQILTLDGIHQTKKHSVESLSVAASAVQSSVSVIRKHLAVDERFCPVCHADYEPGVLLERMEIALNKLNPELSAAIDGERLVATEKMAAEGILQESKTTLLECQNELQKLNKALQDNQQFVSGFIIRFDGCSTADEASAYIKKEYELASEKLRNWSVVREGYEPLVGEEKIENSKIEMNQAASAKSEMEGNLRNLQQYIESKSLELEVAVSKIEGKDREFVLGEVQKKDKEVVSKKDACSLLDVRLKNLKVELSDCESKITSCSSELLSLQRKLDGIRAKWDQNSLRGEPSEGTLADRITFVSGTVTQLEAGGERLNEVSLKLELWRGAEKFHEVNKEISKLKGDSTEAEYLGLLASSIEEKNIKLTSLRNRRDAVNHFMNEVKEASLLVHKEVESINDPWKTLLKRIVISPLISNASLLRNDLFRGSPRAKISANIHNKNFSIADIASEAQLSDLQLTFMLAAANKYNWTPWKALLLDDPTQHHDLVHSSSVFDVLRDYIIDFGYQVMMSTHDSTQAKFFHRKLENDGVPAKIYQLVSRKGGVMAERLK